MRRTLTAHRGDERGVALVMVALLLLALIGMVGLAVDGAAMFSTRRQTQNGADAAALAGTNALNSALIATTDALGHEGDAYVAALASISTNRASSGSTVASGTDISCWIIDQYQTRLGTCPTANNGLGLPSNSDGVEITLGDTRQTNFIQAVGQKAYTVHNKSAALIESYSPTTGISPFMICAVSSVDSRSGGGASGFQDPPIYQLNTTVINPAALNQTYELEGGDVKKGCGTNGNFKGDVAPVGSPYYPVPGVWQSSVGYSNSFQKGAINVLGGCADELNGCRILVPLCFYQSGGWYCQQMAVFELSGLPGGPIMGTLLAGGGVVSGGQGGGKPAANDLRMIKLAA